MVIEVIDLDKLMVRHAIWGSESSFKSQYEVFAIRKWHKRTQYLVENCKRLHWWDTDLFNVVDESIPESWVTVQYKRFHRFKNKNYDFYISTSFYQGPKVFLENENFFFDIIENAKDAYTFLCEVLQEHTKVI